MPPKVAIVFDVVSGGRTIGGGSPPGSGEAADSGVPGKEPITAAAAVVVYIPINGATDGSAIMDDKMCTVVGAVENSLAGDAIDADVDAPASGWAGGALSTGVSAPPNGATDDTLSADVDAPTDGDASGALSAGVDALTNDEADDTISSDVGALTNNAGDDALNAGIVIRPNIRPAYIISR